MEWVHATVSSLGLLVQAWILRDAWRDWRWCVEWIAATEMHRMFSGASLRGEIIRFAMALLFFITGIVAVSVAPPPGDLSPGSAWKLAALVCSSTLLMMQGVMARMDRKRVVHHKDDPSRNSGFRGRATDGA